MAIGQRIKKRLEDLGWERRDLMERVPDLTPQALSNLINRDSVRSEWDMPIAEALGVSVLWLVYGIEEKYSTQAKVSDFPAREPAVDELLAAARNLSTEGIRELVGQARLLAKYHPKVKETSRA